MIAFVLAATMIWPRQYNAGVTAYRSNDFNSAATTFEQATASPDRMLQQKSFYNLGNTQYRQGEAHWERALKSYESALALDPKDEDAKFNHEFVKKRLEELKKQQEQQQQQQQQQENQEQQKKEQQQQDSRKDAEAQGQPKQQKQEQPGQPQPAQAGNLDKQQAKALLDNLREDERNWNFFPEVQMKDFNEGGEPAKDW
jgi:Ca-activated chloride channel family protein